VRRSFFPRPIKFCPFFWREERRKSTSRAFRFFAPPPLFAHKSSHLNLFGENASLHHHKQRNRERRDDDEYDDDDDTERRSNFKKIITLMMTQPRRAMLEKARRASHGLASTSFPSCSSLNFGARTKSSVAKTTTTTTTTTTSDDARQKQRQTALQTYAKNFQTQQELSRAIELGKPPPENAWWCYKYFWDPIVVESTPTKTNETRKKTDYVLRTQRKQGAINSYFPTFVYRALSGYRGDLPMKEFEKDGSGLHGTNFPWMWMWLRQATSMESWFPTQVPVLAHVVGEGDAKRKPPPFSGTPKKITTYYQLKAKNTMEMTVKGNQLLDFMSANSLLYYSSQSGNDWWSKWPLKLKLKKRKQMWLTIVGLPREESLMMHEALFSQVMKDAAFIYATDWTFSKKLKKTFLGTDGSTSRPDSKTGLVHLKKTYSSDTNDGTQLVSTQQMKELIAPHVVAPTYFPFPFFNKDASNNPLVVAFVLPSKATNEKAVEELSDIFRFARETNVDIAVCGLELDNKRNNDTPLSELQWQNLQNETVRLTQKACSIEWENRMANAFEHQERAFIDTFLDLDETIEALKQGHCTSKKAKEKFDDIAWTFSNAKDMGDKNDGYLGRTIRFFVQLGFDNKRTDDAHHFENFGNRAKVAILDTLKCLNGELTEDELISREEERKAIFAKAEKSASDTSPSSSFKSSTRNSEIFPPLTQLEEVLQRFRRAYFVKRAKETLYSTVTDKLGLRGNSPTELNEFPVGVLRYAHDSMILKSVDELERASGLPRNDLSLISTMGVVEYIEKAMMVEEQNLEDMKEKLNELKLLCDDEATPILAQDEEEIDILIHRVIKANEEASKRFAYFQEKDRLSLLPQWNEFVENGAISFAEINSRSREFTKVMQMMESRLQKLEACKDLMRAMSDNDHFTLKDKIAFLQSQSAVPNEMIEKAILRQKELQKAYAQYLKDTRVKRGMSAYKQRYSGEVNAGKSIWYDRKHILGTGSLGVVVYKGYYDEKHPTKEVVNSYDAAIKRIPLDADSKKADERRQLLRREFEVHRKVASRRIIRLFGAELNVHEDDDDDDDSNKAAYVATELCGQTLTSWLVTGAGAHKKKDAAEFKEARQSVKVIPWEKRVQVVSQIAVAVKEIHASGVAHNDIKADNCLQSAIIDEEGKRMETFKISDFGLAKEFDDRFQSFEGSQGTQNFTSKFTMGPSTLGTGSMQNPLREPPEVLIGDRSGVVKLTPKRDVWDLGCLAFQVLTGAWSPYSSVEIKETDFAAITRMNQKKRDGRYENLNNLLAVANLPRHVQVVANYLIGKTLHQNPKKRPTSAEFVSMMQLWNPEFCMEQIEELADRCNPSKVGRSMSLIGDQTTQDLVERAWGGRKAEAKRVTENINNWKDQILSSLLQSSERRRGEFTRGEFSSSSSSSSSGNANNNNSRPLLRSQKLRERRKRRRMVASDDTGDASPTLLNAEDSGDNIPEDKMETLKVSSASLESLATEMPEDKKQEQLSAGAYTNDFLGLILCIRNIWTHPPMPRRGDGGEGLRIQREMKNWLSANGAPFVEEPGEDELDKLERLVELYFVTRFPDAAIIAYNLLHGKK